MGFLEVRTQHTFLENLISKYDTGPVKLPGLSRNGPLGWITSRGQTGLERAVIIVPSVFVPFDQRSSQHAQ